MGTPLDSALEETIRTLDGTRGTWGGTDDINRLVHELATVVLRTRGQFDALMSDRIESNHTRLDRHGGRLDVITSSLDVITGSLEVLERRHNAMLESCILRMTSIERAIDGPSHGSPLADRPAGVRELLEEIERRVDERIADLGPEDGVCDDGDCPDADAHPTPASEVGSAILRERERMQSSMCLRLCTALGWDVSQFKGEWWNSALATVRDSISLTAEMNKALGAQGMGWDRCLEMVREFAARAHGLEDLKARLKNREIDIEADLQARAVLIRDRDEAVKRHADLLTEFDVVRKQRDDALACVEATETKMQEALASIGSWRRS